jgi:predicted dehydrogenase
LRAISSGGVNGHPSNGAAQLFDGAGSARAPTVYRALSEDCWLVEKGDWGTALATQLAEGLVVDTGVTIPKTAPDQLAVTGFLSGGAVASMHFRGAARRTTPLVWEIDGTEGSLRITGDVGLPMSATLRVEGAHGDEPMAPMNQPDDYDKFPTLAGTPAHNVAHLYAHVADTLRGEDSDVPTFEDGVELHRILESITSTAKKRP